MKLLRDVDLQTLIESGTPPFLDPKPTPDDWYGAKSPVQAASIDLHVGAIFLPGRGTDSTTKFALRTGQTAVVRTLERVHFSSKLTGIGFPPSRISSQGILMTNPGHIDPGYEGYLHLTVINMGREPFELKKDDSIVTVVLFELDTPPQKDWKLRYGEASPSEITKDSVDRLSADFVDVQQRAESIAHSAVKQAALNLTLLGSIATIVIALGTLYFNSQSKIDLLNQSVSNLEKSFNERVDTNKRLEELERRIAEIERRPPASGPVKHDR
jgi:deoxycytidine triphosphate deaminase